MPRIFDNISHKLLPALCDALEAAYRADFCVGYFNLRGWKLIDSVIGRWPGGEGASCRLLVGMQSLPQEELRAALSLTQGDEAPDQGAALRLKKQIADEFRQQLMVGAPNNQDEAGLQRLSAQLKAKQVVVKLFLHHHLHAKLYLLHRQDAINPTVGFLGSSNLTFAGLSKQGELMTDMQENSYDRRMRFGHDSLTVQHIFPKRSKPIIDEIDRVLAKHYGFTDEELDFIINHDVSVQVSRGSG